MTYCTNADSGHFSRNKSSDMRNIFLICNYSAHFSSSDPGSAWGRKSWKLCFPNQYLSLS